jgi:hypothetical protein
VVGEKENKGLAGLGFLKAWGILALAALWTTTRGISALVILAPGSALLSAGAGLYLVRAIRRGADLRSLDDDIDFCLAAATLFLSVTMAGFVTARMMGIEFDRVLRAVTVVSLILAVAGRRLLDWARRAKGH